MTLLQKIRQERIDYFRAIRRAVIFNHDLSNPKSICRINPTKELLDYRTRLDFPYTLEQANLSTNSKDREEFTFDDSEVSGRNLVWNYNKSDGVSDYDEEEPKSNVESTTTSNRKIFG